MYKGNVLFVDDSKVNLMMGSKLISHFGLDVKVAENGQQAIELCKLNQFQLIFMDLEMPEVGGLDASAIIREKKLSFAPIYALTGNDSEGIRKLCRNAHMNGFIEKPIKKDKIKAILDIVFL
ncbi:MAG: response regulator [Gammaproteobacteria bacterium]|nr:response regulator [Gammaproteobacteria bacterium]